MAPTYLPFSKAVPPLVFYDPSTIQEISLTNPCKATPTQSAGFSNCPLIAALASLVWVNRNIVTNPNNTAPVIDTNGNTTGYTFTFWDYGQKNSMTINNVMGQNVATSGFLNPLDASGNPVPGAKITVTVNFEVLLDSNFHFSDSNGFFYGAGSILPGEAWQALFERAYGKFCYYENKIPLPSTGNIPTCTNGVIGGSDPTYNDLLMLGNNPAQPQLNFWGGNAGIGLVYLTGCNCFQLSTVPNNCDSNGNTFYSVPTGSSLPATTNSSSLYSFIKAAFCSENRKPYPYGLNKTRYPLVAWTYAAGAQFNGSPIMSAHCYTLLGTVDASNTSNGKNHIVLRDITKAATMIPTNSDIITSPSGGSSWPYWDARFKIGVLAQSQYPPSSASKLPHSPVSSPASNGIFSLDEAQFKVYFQSIGWAEGY